MSFLSHCYLFADLFIFTVLRCGLTTSPRLDSDSCAHSLHCAAHTFPSPEAIVPKRSSLPHMLSGPHYTHLPAAHRGEVLVILPLFHPGLQNVLVEEQVAQLRFSSASAESSGQPEQGPHPSSHWGRSLHLGKTSSSSVPLPEPGAFLWSGPPSIPPHTWPALCLAASQMCCIYSVFRVSLALKTTTKVPTRSSPAS